MNNNRRIRAMRDSAILIVVLALMAWLFVPPVLIDVVAEAVAGEGIGYGASLAFWLLVNALAALRR